MLLHKHAGKLPDLRPDENVSCYGSLEKLEMAKNLVNRVKLEEFILVLKEEAAKGTFSSWEPPRYPIAFNTLKHEINFIITLHALNFGSVFYPEAQDGILWKSIEGCLGLYLEGGSFTASFLSNVDEAAIERVFRLRMKANVPITEGSPITILGKGPDHDFASSLLTVCHDSGRILQNHASDSFYDFFFPDGLEKVPNAQELIDRMAMTFPCFDDPIHGEKEDPPTGFYSKARKAVFHVFGVLAREDKIVFIEASKGLVIPVDHIVVDAMTGLEILKGDSYSDVEIRADALSCCSLILENVPLENSCILHARLEKEWKVKSTPNTILSDKKSVAY